MGVKTLWPVLQEAVDCKNVPIESLQGKRVAVDLSSWIVEFQKVKAPGASIPKNIYIRSLYYRTTELLGYGVKLIFVADGKAPDMKTAVLKKRREAQYGEQAGASVDTGRHQFSLMAAKCKELLTYLGLPFLYSDGEGEALCAALNAQGVVDAVMTSDVDAFLYGAKTVYRDYRVESGEHVVDVYTMEKIEEKLGLDRRSMVVTALLVGCDMSDVGVEGVGIKKALSLIDHIKKRGTDPLDRLIGWRNNDELDITKNCKGKGEKSLWLKEHKLELNIRAKAMANESFPNQEIIDEYIKGHRQLESPPSTFKPIDISGVKIFMTNYFPSTNSKLGEFYSNFASVLVQLQLHDMNEFLTPATTLKPLRITHNRIRHGKPNLEVQWSKLDEDRETKGDFYSVLSKTDTFKKKFPDMAATFSQEIEDKKHGKKASVKRKSEQLEGKSTNPTLKSFFPIKKKAVDNN